MIITPLFARERVASFDKIPNLVYISEGIVMSTLYSNIPSCICPCP